LSLQLVVPMIKVFNNNFFSIRMLAFGALVFVFFACNSSGSKKDSGDSEKDIIESVPMNDQLVDDFNKSKLIFYSLPSPLETAMLIKRAGASFDPEILNPLDNISKYNTNFKMALNLGIYSADLSYASLFDQSQITIEYMGNSRKLADNLGILGAIDEQTIRELEENMNNREVVMNIISETYMNSNAYLSENNRAAISVMVLAGGWIEGLYLATSLTRGSLQNNKKLVDRILYQKLSLVTLMNMMATYENQNSDIESLMADLQELADVFDKVTIVNTSEVEAVTDTMQKITTIKAQSEIEISPDDYIILCEKIAELRNNFIS
jgi:Asp-tRNA(Asn)/Glu-tRNA(Gln) amidotransferase C subunit